MATKKLNTRIQNKIDSEANWNNNPDFIPLKGEMIVYSKDANNKAARIKFGDGVTKLKNLKFSGGSGVPLTPVKKPTVRGSLTYNKSSQTPTWLNYDSSKMTLSGTTSATNAGTYTATFTPLTGYCWEDDESTSAINVTWTINKAPANLTLNNTLLAIDSTFESKTFTYTSDSSGSISVTCVVYTAEGNLIGAALEPSVSGSSITITRFASVDEISYGTITVTQAATTNYLEATVEITVQAITGLDGYSWEQIAEFVGTSDAGNLGAIGDTKTITLTPNQRIRLPQGEENVKVFLADAFESNGDGTGEAYGYLFAGFKDSDGRDICITPDPKIREKQWIPATEYIGSVSSVERSTLASIGSSANGTYTVGDSIILVESWWEDTSARCGQGAIYVNNVVVLEWDTFGDVITTYDAFPLTAADSSLQYVYMDKSLYRLFKLFFTAEVGYPQLAALKWNDRIDLQGLSNWSSSDSGSIADTSVIPDGAHPYSTLSYSDSELYYTNNLVETYRLYSLTGGWLTTDYTARYMINVTPHVDSEWWLFENTTPVNSKTLNRYWEGTSILTSVLGSLMDSYTIQQLLSSVNLYDSNVIKIPCEFYYSYNDQQEDYAYLKIRYLPSDNQGEIIGVKSSEEESIFSSNFDGTFGMGGCIQFYASTTLSYPKYIIAVFNIILDAMNQFNVVKGSWIWNESVLDNLSSLSEETMININFRAGDMISEDGLPQMQYCIDPTIANYLSYEGPNNVSVVQNGVFHPEYAAMHFGDEPQSVPKYFYYFLVDNADYMSYGFSGGLIDDANYNSGYPMWSTPMSKVLGYTVDDHGYGNYLTATNTLYEALPSEFKKVLSSIYEHDPVVGTSSGDIPCRFSLPYINEIGVLGDEATGHTSWITSERLGYSSSGEAPITYYYHGNSSVKYDIWNKTAPVLQHSASMGEYTPGLPAYALVGTTDKTAVTIENVEELKKPQFVSAGLAPIFLIGSSVVRTWRLNSKLDLSTNASWEIPFTTLGTTYNGSEFVKLEIKDNKDLYYETADGTSAIYYSTDWGEEGGVWGPPDYDVLTFTTALPDDLAAWLDANGTEI